jgi:drug/metabolite transporter (DMT)-like permease
LTCLYAGIRQRRIVLPAAIAWPGIALLALCQTILQYLFIYIGLAHTASSKGSILNQVGVFLLVLLSPLLFREEKLTAQKLAGSLLGMAGIVLINLTGAWSWRMTFVGEGFVILSSLSAAAGYVISKKLVRTGDPVLITGAQQLLGGLVLLVPGLAGGGRLVLTDPTAIALLLFLSISVAVVYILWLTLLQKHELSTIAIYKFGVPVVSYFASALLLQESVLTRNSLLALVLVSGGIILVNLRNRRSVPPGS